MPEIPLGTVVGPQGPPGPKGDTGTFSPEDLQRISDLESGKVDKVSGKGLSTNDYTTADKNAVATIGNKVDKVTGKGLSTNDYTTAEKNKLSGIAAEANKTLIDATLSNAGQAADAKTTGDNFSAFRELLRRMEIHCTASGNPATFSDADAANVKALSVTITPTQEGEGDPYPPGGGKNLLEISATSETRNGITFTVDSVTGVVQVNGTASDTAFLYLNNDDSGGGRYNSGNWILSGCPSGGSETGYSLRVYRYGNAVAADTGNGIAFNGNTNLRIGIAVMKGFTVNNLAFYPMIRRASDTDPTFAPYSNIRPISGVSSVTVRLDGNEKNLANILRFANGTFQNGVIEASTNRIISPFIPIRPNTKYALSVDPNFQIYEYCYYHSDAPEIGWDAARTWGGTINATSAVITTTNNSDLTYIAFSVRAISGEYAFTTSNVKWVQFEQGDAVTPYNGQTVTVQLTDGSNPLTVYGGTLDVTTGTLSVTWVNIASYSGETLPGRWISDRDVYASGATPTTGAQVVYELAAPVTYQLTPAQLATLSGYNAVSTDAASVSVTYKADTNIILGGG